MAFKMALFAALAVAILASANARDLTVGNSFGWQLPGITNQTFYQQWADAAAPQVGDNLIFNYEGNYVHNLFLSNTSNPFSIFCRIVGDPAKGKFLPNATGTAGKQYNYTIPGPGYYAISDPTVLETGNPTNLKSCARGMRMVFRITASPPPPLAPPPPPPNTDDGLSGGAIAGIVIGSVVGALLLLGLLGFLLSRKKKEVDTTVTQTTYVEPTAAKVIETPVTTTTPATTTYVAPASTTTYATPATETVTYTPTEALPATTTTYSAPASTTYSAPAVDYSAPTTTYTAPAVEPVSYTPGTYSVPGSTDATVTLPKV